MRNECASLQPAPLFVLVARARPPARLGSARLDSAGLACTERSPARALCKRSHFRHVMPRAQAPGWRGGCARSGAFVGLSAVQRNAHAARAGWGGGAGELCARCEPRPAPMAGESAMLRLLARPAKGSGAARSCVQAADARKLRFYGPCRPLARPLARIWCAPRRLSGCNAWRRRRRGGVPAGIFVSLPSEAGGGIAAIAGAHQCDWRRFRAGWAWPGGARARHMCGAARRRPASQAGRC